MKKTPTQVMGNKAKYIGHKNKRDSILQARATNENEEIFECGNAEEMMLYMAKLNLSQQQQSIETPFMIFPLVDIFGYLAEDKLAQEISNCTIIAPRKHFKVLS